MNKGKQIRQQVSTGFFFSSVRLTHLSNAGLSVMHFICGSGPLNENF